MIHGTSEQERKVTKMSDKWHEPGSPECFSTLGLHLAFMSADPRNDPEPFYGCVVAFTKGQNTKNVYALHIWYEYDQEDGRLIGEWTLLDEDARETDQTEDQYWARRLVKRALTEEQAREWFEELVSEHEPHEFGAEECSCFLCHERRPDESNPEIRQILEKYNARLAEITGVAPVGA